MKVALVLGLLLVSPTAGAETLAVEDLVQRALRSSPALEQAGARARASAARLDQSRTEWRPTLDLSQRWSHTDNPPGAFMSILNQGRLTPEIQADLNDPTAVGDFTTAVTLRYLLTDFGGRKARREGARAELERAQLMEEATRRFVEEAVRIAWHELIEARASTQLWQRTLGLIEVDEKLTKARVDEGAALQSDLLSVEVRVAEARENLLSARHGVEIARARLESLVGERLPALSSMREDPGLPAPPPEESALVAAAIATHPRLAALAAADRAAEAGIEAARALRRPRLVADGGWEWHGDSQGFGLERDSYLAALALEVPLYDAGRARAAKAEALALREELAGAQREALLGIELAARIAHRRLDEALSRIELAEIAAGSAAAAHRIVRERHEAGLAPLTDLLAAERRLTEARMRAVTARAAAWKADAMLRSVAGGRDP